jgi:hypothetical protein
VHPDTGPTGKEPYRGLWQNPQALFQILLVATRQVGVKPKRRKTRNKEPTSEKRVSPVKEVAHLNL